MVLNVEHCKTFERKIVTGEIFNSDVQFINASAEKDVKIKDVKVECESIGDRAIFKLGIEIMTTVKLEQLQIIVMTSNANWNVCDPVHFFRDPKPHESVALQTLIQELENHQDFETFSDEINLVVSYINKQGITRVFRRIVRIEPKFLIEKSVAQKEGSFKVTLSFLGAVEIKKMLAGK